MQHSPAPEHTSPLIGRPPPDPWHFWLGAALFYLAIGLAWTWPLALHWSNGAIQIGSQPVDTGQNVWNLWWSLQSLRAGQDPFTTSYLFFPQSIDLFWQTLGISNALTVLPLIAWLGPVAAFNIVLLLSFVLGGLFSYRLARNLVAPAPALLAGFIVVVAPYRFPPIYAGALEITAIHWLPLLVLLLMRALQRPAVHTTLFAGLLLGLTSLSSHYYGLFGAVYVAAHGSLAALLARPPGRRLAMLVVTAGVLACWLALLLPFLDLGAALGAVEPGDWFERQLFHSAALVDLLPLNVFHPLWGEAATELVAALHPFGIELGLAPGLLVYALIAVALLRRWRQAWPWLLLGLLMLLLAMGPRLKIDAQPTALPLPYALLDLLGPFRNSSRPSRFVALMMLPVAMLSALGIAGLRDWLRWPPRTIYLGLGLLLALELAVRQWPILDLNVAPLYSELRGDTLAGAVMELPPGLDDSRQMLNQLCHGRPLAGGYLARTPAYAPARHESTMYRLWRISPARPDIFPAEPAAELASYGIHYVTLDQQRLTREELAILREELGGAGIIKERGEPLELYRIDPQAARPVLLPGDGWYSAESGAGQRWRWMGATAQMKLLSAAPALVAVRLEASAYTESRPLHISLNGTPIYSGSIPAAPARQAFRLKLAVPAGLHELELQSTAAESPEGRTLSLSFGPIELEQQPPPAAMAQPLPPALPAAAGTLCRR